MNQSDLQKQQADQSNQNPKLEVQQLKDEISEQLQAQTHQIRLVKEMELILKSQLLTDEDKEKKLISIYELLKKMNNDEIQLMINMNLFIIINSFINDCNTEIEKILLNIVEFIVKNQDLSKFSNINCSGLIGKIENLIKQKIYQKEKEEIEQYSEIIEYLVQIYLWIMTYKQVDNEIINICIKILDKNLTNKSNKLKNIGEEKDQKNKIQIKNEQNENDLIRTISTIQAVGQFRDEYGNAPDLIINLMKEIIIPLIYINYPQELQYQFCIINPKSKSIQEFKAAIFNSLANVSKDDPNFISFLVNNHNILSHITPSIISFANSLQLSNNIYTNEQSQYTSQLIFSFINLLHILINSNNYQSIVNIPKFLFSFIKLNNYNLDAHFKQEQDQFALQIRKNSRQCVYWIQQLGDNSIQTLLLTLGYLRLQSSAICTAGGIGENDNSEIRNVLFYISELIIDFHNERKFHPIKPQPILAQLTNEQIEEEGVLEEVEGHLINKEKVLGVDIKFNAAKQYSNDANRTFHFFSFFACFYVLNIDFNTFFRNQNKNYQK